MVRELKNNIFTVFTITIDADISVSLSLKSLHYWFMLMKKCTRLIFSYILNFAAIVKGVSSNSALCIVLFFIKK